MHRAALPLNIESRHGRVPHLYSKVKKRLSERSSLEWIRDFHKLISEPTISVKYLVIEMEWTLIESMPLVSSPTGFLFQDWVHLVDERWRLRDFRSFKMQIIEGNESGYSRWQSTHYSRILHFESIRVQKKDCLAWEDWPWLSENGTCHDDQSTLSSACYRFLTVFLCLFLSVVATMPEYESIASTVLLQTVTQLETSDSLIPMSVCIRRKWLLLFGLQLN